MDNFEEFLKKQKEADEKASKKVDWAKRKEKYLKSIDSLYSEVNNWLASFVSKGLIQIITIEFEIQEENIGTYKVKRLEIKIGKDKITLNPKGTLILGSFGRIDMRGPKGDLIMVEPEWNKWKFAKRTPKLSLWDVDNESFQASIQSIITG